jgi:hypothetical protein
MGSNTEEKWHKAGMKVINSHSGKKKVYETYLKKNPKLAEEYLRFISRHPDAVYITWDSVKRKFVA